MNIAVGSHNPVKISTVQNVLGRVYPYAEILPVEVASGVSDMPLSDEEAIRGARTRAYQARHLLQADLGVGLEGGTTTIDGEHLTSGWAAVFDGKNYGIGGGGHLLLPPEVDRKILQEKKELGTAIDELVGGENLKQKMGAIGILTGGLSTRQKAYEHILIYALAPLLSPELYGLPSAYTDPTKLSDRSDQSDLSDRPDLPDPIGSAGTDGTVPIAVGSKNPLKLQAVESILGNIFPEARFVAVKTESGVSHTPLSNEETITGATRRAGQAREITGADWGIGLEGGMAKIGGNWFTCVWCVIKDGEKETRGGGIHFQLPDMVVRGILDEGKEMGICIDELTGTTMSKRKMGAEGILTRGLIDRKATFGNAIIYALAPRISETLYRRLRLRR
ncbi:MAG: inosine/xanthosine triphosphatase [Candidatus Auribacterota bacterium]|nr:inosine/xanthosine triphosphatase [Candidatus Auribacterota bacterium]